MRIITITNQKGGCGKTTTAVNLAASLAVNAKRVLLIDLDPQSHATLGLNVKSDLSIYNVLSKLTSKKVGIGQIIKNIDDNFDIAPSSIILSTLEQELAGEIGRESRLNDVMQESRLAAAYDYVLIDCPPNLGLLTINAIRAADEVIVPVEASRFSLEGLDQLLGILDLVRERLNHQVAHKILVTNFDSRLKHSFDMLDHIKARFKSYLFSTIVHVNVKLKEAQSSGTHIFNFDKYCRGAKDYFSLSREVIVQHQFSASPEPVQASEDKMSQRMDEIIRQEMPKLSDVVFTVNAPDASDVYVAGEFNEWKLDDSSRMERVDNGTWKKRVSLMAGTYRYQFVIDGKWSEDSDNPLREKNPYGSMNSLVDVG
jgi:chromosome partitioning protein